jgi:hypothetical protein
MHAAGGRSQRDVSAQRDVSDAIASAQEVFPPLVGLAAKRSKDRGGVEPSVPAHRTARLRHGPEGRLGPTRAQCGESHGRLVSFIARRGLRKETMDQQRDASDGAVGQCARWYVVASLMVVSFRFARDGRFGGETVCGATRGRRGGATRARRGGIDGKASIRNADQQPRDADARGWAGGRNASLRHAPQAWPEQARRRGRLPTIRVHPRYLQLICVRACFTPPHTAPAGRIRQDCSGCGQDWLEHGSARPRHGGGANQNGGAGHGTAPLIRRNSVVDATRWADRRAHQRAVRSADRSRRAPAPAAWAPARRRARLRQAQRVGPVAARPCRSAAIAAMPSRPQPASPQPCR